MKISKLLVVLLLSLGLLSACGGKGQKQESIFYPPLPLQPRLQFLTSFTTEKDLGKTGGALTGFILGENPAGRYVARPHDISSVKGKFYMTDRTFKEIVTVDLETGTIDYLRDKRAGSTASPFGLYIDDKNYKYVSDADRKQILLYDQNDTFVRAYGEKDQFEKPMDVAVFGDKIYVVDMEAFAVVVLDKTSGKTIQVIGGRGGDPGRFDRPTHIKIDTAGNLYVNDSFNFRIQKFDPTGKYLKEFGFPGVAPGGFGRPKGMDVSPDGHLYVVDAAFENIQVFDPETTTLLMPFAKLGGAPGNLALPSALYIDTKNMEYFQKYADPDFKLRYLVVVSNLVGKYKVNVYGFGDWIGEKLPEMTPPPAAPPKSGVDAPK
ncbi:MAG: 6-bladed beta-propeller [Desulfoarculaceae bacterium]|nr:6-bladed beta-propeller [Desulfoarculaceae bacterium]